jgi:hypothetical protein
MAIRRPNKPPTTGTQVYNPSIAASGYVNTGFPVDAQFQGYRLGSGGFPAVVDRLRGISTTNIAASANSITTSSAAAETNTNTSTQGWDNSGYTALQANAINWNFARAPGFFDEVCYTGTGTTGQTYNHNLTVVPELMIVKSRSVASSWYVYSSTIGNTNTLVLNSTAATAVRNVWGNTSPTSTVFSVGVNGNGTNNPSATYVAYLFATLAGISKVGSYTGNGTSQNIECGFAAGARFFLVKATSTTGSWWVWDSARGITAGNDPALQLNSTAAEITTADAVDPYAAGITVNQEATCSINASGVSYVYLAIS